MVWRFSRWMEDGRKRGWGEIKAIFIFENSSRRPFSIPHFFPRSTSWPFRSWWARTRERGGGGGVVMDKSGTINESLETERYYPFLRKQCRSFFHLTRRQKLFISPSKESSTSRAEGLKRVKRVREGDRTAGGEREGGAKGDATEEGIEGGGGGGGVVLLERSWSAG